MLKDVLLLGPELALLGVAFLVILLDVFNADERIQGWLAGLGVLGTGVVLAAAAAAGGRVEAFGGMLVLDNFGVFFKALLLASLFVVILASVNYLPRFAGHKGEYFAMLLMATAGMMLLVSSNEFITLFVALETTSIGLYILAGFGRDAKSSEAGLKYLLLGAISSAVLLYGIALVYALTGSTDFPVIAKGVPHAHEAARSVLLLALTFLVAGFGFKLATVPFQMWVPDVYEGAPTPVTMFLSVSSKAAGFAVVLRVFQSAFGVDPLIADWSALFAWLAGATMTIGNVVAIPQTNIKRMMGYSSIAQAGYLMVGLAVVQASGVTGLLFYLTAYAVTNLAAFFAIAMISERIGSEQIADYGGLFSRAPFLAIGLGFCMLSLTGIPPTAGFWGKIYLFGAAVEHGMAWLALVGVINSVISAYYYLGVVRAMFLMSPADEKPLNISPALGLALTVVAALVLVIGVYPSPFIGAAIIASQALHP